MRINGNTKRGKELLDRAKSNKGNKLYDVYSSFSAKKAKAYDDCYRRFYEDDNHANFHICSANGYQFTVAWQYTDKETGEVMIHFETKDSIYLIYNVSDAYLI